MCQYYMKVIRITMFLKGLSLCKLIGCCRSLLHMEYWISWRVNDLLSKMWWHFPPELARRLGAKCSSIFLFEHFHGMEQYLVDLADAHKYNLAKFRTHTHHLPVTKVRFIDYTAGVTCLLCSSWKTGNECHYPFHCDFFKEPRKKFQWA